MIGWHLKRHIKHVCVRFWSLWSTGVLVLALVGVVAAPWFRGRTLYDTATSATVNANPQFGVEPGGSLIGLSQSQLTSTLANIKELGVTWIRFDVSWAAVQPNNIGSYNWSGYDRVVKAIQAAHLEALGTIDYSPEWAQTLGLGGTQVPPDNDAAFATFAGMVAARYASYGLHAWEIWNEPNWADFWPPAPNAAAYTLLLKDSYLAIHLANPGAVVVAAGLSGTGTSGTQVAATEFLNQMYANGAQGYFDALAMHPYTFPRLATDAMAGSWQELYALHNIMSSNGDGSKRIWITEYGAPTGGPGAASPAGEPSRGSVNHVSDDAQAQILTSAVQAYESLTFAGPFFWYNYQDTPTAPYDADFSYGLLNADGSQKPAYSAYQKAIAAAK
jgi:hypothetical protein